MSKHLFANDATDWVVAETVEQAVELWLKHAVDSGMADTTDDAREEYSEDLEFTQEPDDKKLTCNDDGVKTTKTAREWAEESEPGFLFSTNY